MKNRYVKRAGKPARIIVSRILPGSDLLQSIREIVAEEEIKYGIIFSGVGAMERVRIRNLKEVPEKYPITDANRDFRTYDLTCEILTLSGDIYEVEEENLPQVHVHGTFSFVQDGKVSTVGGHLLPGCIVVGFAEVYTMEISEIEMIKRFDEETQTTQLFA
ncbi:TPA: DNA-binding protein [Candidatus Poribacteria bacterium]|nr:DNA-binding protein [Candidatus Poribacteria bacterium]